VPQADFQEHPNLLPAGAVSLMAAIRKFVDDDEGYLRWLENHPDGFVVNFPKEPQKTHKILLHRSCCYCVCSPYVAKTWTTGRNIKVCCCEEYRLFEWIVFQKNKPLHLCSKCHPRPGVSRTIPVLRQQGLSS
jgi:hypothetical protein